MTLSRFFTLDWFLLHDQPVLGRHRHAILRDEETRDGTDATGTRTLHELIDTRIEHQQLGTHDVLRRDCQIHCAPLSTPQTPFD